MSAPPPTAPGGKSPRPPGSKSPLKAPAGQPGKKAPPGAKGPSAPPAGKAPGGKSPVKAPPGSMPVKKSPSTTPGSKSPGPKAPTKVPAPGAAASPVPAAPQKGPVKSKSPTATPAPGQGAPKAPVGPASGKKTPTKTPVKVPPGGGKSPVKVPPGGGKSPVKAPPGGKSPVKAPGGKSPTAVPPGKIPGKKSPTATPGPKSAETPPTPAVPTKAPTPVQPKAPGKSPTATPRSKSPAVPGKKMPPGGKSPAGLPGKKSPVKAPPPPVQPSASEAAQPAEVPKPQTPVSVSPAAAATPAAATPAAATPAAATPAAATPAAATPARTPVAQTPVARTPVAQSPANPGTPRARTPAMVSPSATPPAEPPSTAAAGSHAPAGSHATGPPLGSVLPSGETTPGRQGSTVGPSLGAAGAGIVASQPYGSFASPPIHRDPISIVKPPPAPKRSAGPLTVDPRTGLPLIEFPRDRQHAFRHIGTDICLHLFLEVDRISSKGKPLRRVVLVTDQTLFVCEESGAVMRCVPINKIMQANVAVDNSNAVALVIPSEYDVIVRFDHRRDREDLLLVLRGVHRHVVSSELNVQQVKEIKPNQYRMDKPPGFQLQRIPQRTREHLAKSLATIDQQEAERLHAIKTVEARLEADHARDMQAKRSEAEAIRAKLDAANTRLRQQTEELERLRVQHGRCKKRVEEIEEQAGPHGEIPGNKEEKIRELQEVVDVLSQSVSKANEERTRMEALSRRGDFEERDDFDDHVVDQPRFRGRSLHQQGLIEVLQRQLNERERELESRRSHQVDLQKLNIEYRKREQELRELEHLVQAPEDSDPAMKFSHVKKATAADLLDGIRSPGRVAGLPPPTLGEGTSVAVPAGALATDDDGEMVHTGDLPRAHAVDAGRNLPEFELPVDERDFTADPRTGLHFVEIPSIFRDAFHDLLDTVIHFFAVSTKLNKRGREQRRVIVMSDQTLYQCNTSGNINRCLWLTSVREMVIDKNANVALFIDGRGEYDVAFRFERVEVCHQMAEVLRRINKYQKRQPPLKITEVERINPSELRLEKPPTWEFKLHPLRLKRGLFKALRDMTRQAAEARAELHERADQYTLDVIDHVREELRPEVQRRREREFALLRSHIADLDKALREQQMEVRNRHLEMQEHRCTVDFAAQARRGVDAYETQGMYWIPTDPVVMECDLEILHVEFNNNHVVTSHPNGFLNVWEISSAELFRTLKKNGHTARVQAFAFNGEVLISGGHDATLRRWRIAEGTCSFVVPNVHRGHVTCVRLHGNRCYSSGSDGVIQVFTVEGDSALVHLNSLKGHKSAITSFALTNDGRTLASADWGWVLLWDVERGIVSKAIRDDNGGIASLDINGSTLVTGGTGGVLTVWNTHTSEGEPLDGHDDDVTCVQLQQHFAISSSSDGTIRMWNTKERCGLGVFHSSAPQECRTFHFVANRFVIGEHRTIKVWTR